LIAFSCGSACTDRIAVLDAKQQGQRVDGGGGGDAIESPHDAGGKPGSGEPPAATAGSGGDKPGSINTGTVDAGREPPPAAQCDLKCGPNELCTFSRCVPAQGVMSLSAWLGHSCAVEAGRLYCWGPNESGQLGVGDRDDRNRKTRVGSANDWLAVATGEHFSCGIRAPGQLYCWGANNLGQLALGDTEARLEPTAVQNADHVAQLAAGGENACAIADTGELYCWGDNLEGKPGQADPYGSPDVLVPMRVGSDSWKLVAVGQGHVCGVRMDGHVLCWGRNTNLELAIGSDMPEQVREPTETVFTQGFVSLSASQHHSCGVHGDGTLFCWGGNEQSELSLPGADVAMSAPVQVGTDSDWAEAATGWFHSCARKRDGRLFCWGRSIEGQLGQDSDDPIATPTQVQPPATWRRITAGNFFTCGVDDTNALYCTGENRHGELGVGDLERRQAPAALP
jgi:hypothetical protein